MRDLTDHGYDQLRVLLELSSYGTVRDASIEIARLDAVILDRDARIAALEDALRKALIECDHHHREYHHRTSQEYLESVVALLRAKAAGL